MATRSQYKRVEELLELCQRRQKEYDLACRTYYLMYDPEDETEETMDHLRQQKDDAYWRLFEAIEDLNKVFRG